MASDVRDVLDAVQAGLRWEHMEPPNPKSTAFCADGPLHTPGPKFKLTCIRWVEGEHSGYAGVAMVLEPHICIINLPPEAAKAIYEKAASSLN